MSLLEARYLGGCEIRTIQIVFAAYKYFLRYPAAGSRQGSLVAVANIQANKLAFARPVISNWMWVKSTTIASWALQDGEMMTEVIQSKSPTLQFVSSFDVPIVDLSYHEWWMVFLLGGR